MHQVAIGAGPHHGGVDAQVGRHVGHRHDGAVDHVTRDARRIAHQQLARHRAHAVGGDEGIGGVALAVLVDGGNARTVLLDVLDARRSLEGDQLRLLHAFQNRGVDVGAVNHRVRVAKALAERRADGKAPDHAGIHRVHHHQFVGEDGAAARVFAHAKRVERGKGVGRQLNAGADFADVFGLLQQRDADAQLAQRQRRRQTADAAADHQHVLRLGHDVSCGCSFRCSCLRTVGKRWRAISFKTKQPDAEGAEISQRTQK